jgi:hypothetical protein
MEIIVQRGTPTLASIPGELFIQGAHVCFTLERPGVAILSGRYKLSLYPSPHFGRLMPMLDDVPGRENILIHWGSYPTDSEGCILIGEQRDLTLGEIFYTREAFNELFPVIQAAVNTEGAWITVKDPVPMRQSVNLSASDL